MKTLLLALLLANIHISYSVADETSLAVVSLIVDGKDLRHLNEVINEAKALSRKVPIRNLLLIEQMPDLSQMSNDSVKNSPAEQKKIQLSTQHMQAGMESVRALNLEQSEGKTDLSLLDKLRITNSPTWIVRHKGRNYIYEGLPSIDRYFTANGNFKDGD